MAAITEVQKEQVEVTIEKFVEELTELGLSYNKTLQEMSKVQDESLTSEKAMYKITLTNIKRPASYVPTEDEKAADMATVMDFVESRQELINAQTVAFKALQLLQSKQSILVNHVNNINGNLEKKLAELTVETPATGAPSRPSK
jgi:hypothetical protein